MSNLVSLNVTLRLERSVIEENKKVVWWLQAQTANIITLSSITCIVAV